MRKPTLIAAALMTLSLAATPLAGAQEAQQGNVPADWTGCDSTCRAKRENPKPDLVSPTVSPEGEVTIQVWAPKAETVEIGGLDPKMQPAAKSGEDGVWTYTSPKMKAGYHSYFIRVDGVDMIDPSNLWTVGGRTRVESMVEVGDEDFSRNDPDVPHGAVAEVFYRTPGVEFERRMRIYTPPGYGLKPETLPTLYLLHGGQQSEDQWPKLGRAGFILDNLIAEGKAKRMLVVMPDGYVDDFRIPSGSSPDLLTQDLIEGAIPYVEANYSVSKDASDRAVAGLSRGASQTYTIAREAAGAFGDIGIFSFSRSRVNPLRKELEAIENDADWKALADDLGKAKLFYWSVGTEDKGHDDSVAIWKMMGEHGITVVAEDRPGDHEWAVWRASLRDFAQKIFQD
jgi:enterochelin esterase-like enzyme